jgi:hypothetical protein
MKTYTFPQLKKISTEQGYKLAALENPQGEKVVSFNQIKTPIDKAFKTIETRLNSELNPDGVYFILLAHSITKSRTPDRYPLVKGKVSPETLVEVEKKQIPLSPTIVYEKPEVLTWDKAMEYMQKISTLETENRFLKMENASLLAELEDAENEALSEANAPVNSTQNWIEQIATILPSLADKYFELEEKKLTVEALKIGAKPKQQGQQQQTQNTKKQIAPGSQEHIDLIKYWYNSDAANAQYNYNLWMDRLQNFDQNLHDNLLQELEQEGGENE